MIISVILFFNLQINFSQINLGPASGFGDKNLGPLVDNAGSIDFQMLSFHDKAKVFGVGTKEAKVKGSMFLYDNWNGYGVIQIAGKKFKLNNINFNIEQDAFMSKIGGDSVVVFDSNYIDDVKVNNRSFKYLYDSSKGKKKNFEVIHQLNDNLVLLKEYSLKVILADPNSMLNRPIDEIKKREKHVLYKDGELANFKLQKKNVLELIDSKKVKAVKDFVAKYDLSYKNQGHVVRILRYYNSL